MGAMITTVAADGFTDRVLPIHRSVKHPDVEKKEKDIKYRGDIRDTVVIPVDGSKESENAFNYYCDHMHQQGNKLYVLHVYELDRPAGAYYPDYAIPPESWDEVIKECHEYGSKILHKYEERLHNHKIEGILRSEVGRPGHCIVESAHKLQANQIVMGTRGLNLIRRTILGSVSEFVLHHSEVPVTLVPQDGK